LTNYGKVSGFTGLKSKVSGDSIKVLSIPTAPTHTSTNIDVQNNESTIIDMIRNAFIDGCLGNVQEYVSRYVDMTCKAL